MKKIVLFSPVALENETSSISIRINLLRDKFEELGLKAQISNDITSNLKNIDYAYVMVSTKKDSISSKVAGITGENNLIVDLYTPLILEKEAFLSKWKFQDWLSRSRNKKVIREILKSGDYFLVANRRQKNYWLSVAKKIGVPIAKSKIFVLPTGSPSLPVKRQPSKIILWFGGIYPWLNPLPLVDAFALIAKANPAWKLRILGGFHPATGYLGLFQRIVDMAKNKIPRNQLEIIPWQSSQNLSKFLAGVYFAVHLPKKTKEDYYAHRVRLLTLLSSGVPVLTAGSDFISDLLVKNEAGLKISQDTKELADIMTPLIENPQKLNKFSKNALKIEKIFTSSQEINKLKKYLI